MLEQALTFAVYNAAMDALLALILLLFVSVPVLAVVFHSFRDNTHTEDAIEWWD